MGNPLRPNPKTELIPLLFLGLSFIASFYFYASFPQSVPVHWDLSGAPDDYAGKAFGAFFFPLLNAALYLLLLFLPKADPRRANYQFFLPAYHAVKNSLVVFLTLIYFAAGLNILGWPVRINFVAPLLVALLFIVFGLALGRVESNWFLGIRTPWTLSSPLVWKKTHRLARPAFIFIGLAIFVSGFWPAFFPWALAIMLALFILLIVYSYFIFRRQKKTADNG